MPNLGELNFGRMIPAEQMWQDIRATITDVLRPNPDRAPPVEISNEDKIHKAGFDGKTSFRHPVK